ncbi:ATP-dependent DNA helicase RecG [Deferrisoma camini]|uniref:ATP-dependent DNA helicase RecG n=1 Tax=Deferrisoma camini TaxID=1035120 RepID=UPI00046D44EE|nr:ATP-dependent DNA helicase RecG [Deferrisoma camini]
MRRPADLASYRHMRSVLATPLTGVRGVGPKVAEKLARKGLRTLGDALVFLPLRHEDRTRPAPLHRLVPGDTVAFRGRIESIGIRDYHRRRVLEARLTDGNGWVTLKWFRGNFGWLQGRYPPGTEVAGSGAVRMFQGRAEIHHPELEPLEDDRDPAGFERVVPVYSEVEGVHPKALRRILESVLDQALPAVVDLIPPHLADELGLPPMARAFQEVHFPSRGGADLPRWVARHRKALVLEEFFFLQLGLLLRREGKGPVEGIAFRPDFHLIKPLLGSLPFRLTRAQRRVLGEIRRDMEAPRPMHRLLQGDVGSGKTLVALLSALMAVESGYQAAIMAPTEILAEQHALNLKRMCRPIGVEVGCLTSSTPRAEREEVLEALCTGALPIVVGTHALIQDPVEFHRLGLVVVDEQHRFGVLQRAGLLRKGRNPDLLVMTATPIPRSLSLTVYGDLDLSVIDELPPGRQPIATRVVRERDLPKVYAFVREQVGRGRQAYLVYPLVEESEALDLRAATTMAEHFQGEVFPDLKVGLLHGRMRADEKEAVMAAFAAGEIQVLVSTTVIEVGIDVPNATVMVVEHAERFGLAQLHQLRGRVGRGAERSYCVLVAGREAGRDGWERLRVLASTSDGFRIAEEDLRIRGPGDLLGTRQSGLPDFRIGNILRDGPLLQVARDLAARVLAEDPGLRAGRYPALREALQDRWAGRLELAKVG